MTRIAWPQLLQLGLGELQLHPDEFWALTPVELMLLAGLGPTGHGLSRDGFIELAARFPDRPAR